MIKIYQGPLANNNYLMYSYQDDNGYYNHFVCINLGGVAFPFRSLPLDNKL